MDQISWACYCDIWNRAWIFTLLVTLQEKDYLLKICCNVVLLVVLVPKIVPLKYVSTALGAHKSVSLAMRYRTAPTNNIMLQLEQTGSAVFQTIAGLALDANNNKGGQGNKRTSQYLLDAFLLLNVLQFLSILGLAYLQRRKNQELEQRIVSEVDPTDEEQPLINPSESHVLVEPRTRGSFSGTKTKSEIRRGNFFASLCAIFIFFAWTLFLSTAWLRLGKGKGKVHMY